MTELCYASFYVIVEPSIINDHQLRMPDKFVQEHGDELFDTVKLIVPTDDSWCVGVKKAREIVWLHDGLQEFMEHHSVSCWYFLLFKYGQNSCFNVHIFDIAATEIDYQFRSHGNAKLRDVAQDRSHVKDKTVGDKGGKSSVEIVDPPLETEQGPESSAKSAEFSHGAKRRKIASGKIKHWHRYETRSRTNKLHDVGINEKNINISGNSSLTKPLGGNLVRQSMKTPMHSAAGTGDTKKSFTGQQRENSVGRGRYDRRKSRQLRASEASKAIKAAKMPENPYFLKILEKYNVVRNHILNIPLDFVREHMPKTSELIEIQDSDGNKWNIRCIRSNTRMFLSKGWLEFVRDNSLVVGDACVFELIKDLQADEHKLKVHILRTRVEESSTNLVSGSVSEPTLSTGQQREKSVVHGRPYNRRRKRGRPRTAEANKATNAAKMFTPENPCFMITLGEYNVVRNYILNIPSEFVRDYMPKTSETIKLQDSDGNKWNAHCIRRKTSMFLSKGWKKFVKDTCLVLGDACVFELIKNIQADELMLKVHIFRN